MKKEFLLVLLNHLKSANITNIDEILNYDERILNLLAQFDTIHLSKALDIVKVEPNLELCLKN